MEREQQGGECVLSRAEAEFAGRRRAAGLQLPVHSHCRK
jgi:hypothetical protein